MKNNILLILSFAITSCVTSEKLDDKVITITDESNVIQKIIEVDENDEFLEFLDQDWNKNLNENPLFASYIGDKRLNDKINPNTIEQYLVERRSKIASLNQLQKIDITKLRK